MMFYSHVLAIRFCGLNDWGWQLQRVGRRSRRPAGMMDHVIRDIDQLAVAIETRKELDGADDGVGRNFDGHGALDYGREREANRIGAALEKTQGMGMAVDRRVVGDTVVFRDLVSAAPT